LEVLDVEEKNTVREVICSRQRKYDSSTTTLVREAEGKSQLAKLDIDGRAL
jgi:hypothetical protein